MAAPMISGNTCLMSMKIFGFHFARIRCQLPSSTLSNQRNSIAVISATLYPERRNYCRKTNPTKAQDLVPQNDDILIPKRILRRPTDILQALSETVRRDPTAAHYMYHDDPYLIPVSNLQRKEFTLSKESGKRSAKFVVNKYPEYFKTTPFHQEPVPKIPNFMPDEGKVPYTNNDPTEAGLIERLDRMAVEDAIHFYAKVKKAKVSIKDDTLWRLFQIACYFNSSDPPIPESVDFKMVKSLSGSRSGEGDQREESRWENGGKAEEIFRDLPTKGTEAYSVLLRGMLKHAALSHNVYRIFNMMKDEGVKGDVHSYNAVLKVIPSLEEYKEGRWGLVEDIVTLMNEDGVVPNLATFSELLHILSKSGSGGFVRRTALATLAQMPVHDITPGLTAYLHLINIFHKRQTRANQKSLILHSIVQEIEGKTFEISDPSDLEFFHKAMEVCCFELRDVNLALRLHQVLKTGENAKFLADFSHSNFYFTSFFKLLAESVSAEELFKHYNIHVPIVYTPSIQVMNAIIRSVEVHEAYEKVPELWSDVRLFRYGLDGQFQVMAELLKLLRKSIPDDDRMRKRCLEIIKDCLENVQHHVDNNRVQVLSVTGELIQACVIFKELTSAWEVLDMYRLWQNRVTTVPSFESLKSLLRAGLDDGEDAERLLAVVRMSNAIGYPETRDLARAVLAEFELLTDVEKEWLSTICSSDS